MDGLVRWWAWWSFGLGGRLSGVAGREVGGQ